MSDIVQKVADIERRLRGLKAVRPVSISQVELLSEEWSYALTLQALGDPADEAVYKVTIVCGGDPIVDVAMDGFPVSTVAIVPAGVEWDITGDTAIAYIRLLNTVLSVSNMTLTIRAWGLNGLSATCERFS